MTDPLAERKANPGNYFEDFSVGQKFAHSVPRTLTEGDNSLYIALTGDRYPVYCNAEFARTLGYRRELINDLLVFHIVFGKTVSDISLNAVANLGYAAVQFLAPVYPGDTLRAQSTVVGKKENRSGRNGNVYGHTEGHNQDNEKILEYDRWVMVRKQDHENRTGEADIPELATEASLDGPQRYLHPSFDRFDASVTGGRWFFDDYNVGERIHHGAGMTLEEAEHAMAARLYQNTAKVHFDSRLAGREGGRRIVYGGHVISIARALSFNGLENAVRILAWNGGTHANPTFAGDTLYAFTDVLEKKTLSGRNDVGALRLRLVAVKNHDPEEGDLDIMKHDEEKGRDVYHSNVVLDLDYYVAMPRKT